MCLALFQYTNVWKYEKVFLSDGVTEWRLFSWLGKTTENRFDTFLPIW